MAKCRIYTLLTSLAAVLCMVAISACGGSKPEPEKPQATVKEGVKLTSTNSEDTVTETGDWTYRSVKNNLTDAPTYYAECISQSAKHIQEEDLLDMELTIRLCRRPGHPDEVVLAGNRGVFNIGNNSTIVQVRFDDGPVERFSCSVSEEYLSGGLLIDDAKRFISHLRQADSCRIGTTYLHNGELIFTHQLQGLKW